MKKNIKEKLRIIYDALDDKKAEDIKIINIQNVSIIADYFIIAGGKNKNQIQTMSDSVGEELAKYDILPKQIEGYNSANWILMDYQDIIVHIFSEEDRLFYDLERIWRDGKNISIDEI